MFLTETILVNTCSHRNVTQRSAKQRSAQPRAVPHPVWTHLVF